MGIEAILYRTTFSPEHELACKLVFCKAGNKFVVILCETSHTSSRTLLLKVTAVWHEKAGEVKTTLLIILILERTAENNGFTEKCFFI